MFSMKLDPAAISPRIRNPILLALVAAVTFVLLAAYSPLDPEWNQASNNEAVRSFLGSVGSFLSGSLTLVFGYVAYVIPVLLVAKILSIVALPRETRWWVGLVSLGGFLLVVLSLCCLAAAWTGSPIATVEETSGKIGLLLATSLFPIVHVKILAVVGSVGVLLGLQFLIRFSWLPLIETLGRCLYVVATKGSRFLIDCFQWIVNLVSRRGSNMLETSAVPARSTVTVRSRPVSSRRGTTDAKRKEPQLKAKTLQKTPASARPQTVKRQTRDIARLPDLGLLAEFKAAPVTASSQQLIDRIYEQLGTKLADFGVEAEVVSKFTGPVVTRFEIQPAAGVRVSKITALAKDLARALAVLSVRVVEVVPGKPFVGIEIPNDERSIVRLQEILKVVRRSGEMDSALKVVLGKDVAGNPILADIEKMPHLLVAGTTGSGKSVCINAILLSLLLHSTPENVRMILIDPKMLELAAYDEIPHLLTPVVTDVQDASRALGWCIGEMERRYQLMAALNVRNLVGYNALVEAAEKRGEPIVDPIHEDFGTTNAATLTKLPSIVVVVDEFADMIMVVGKKVEQLIARLAQKARAAGIHLILATQRPSVDVITGLIKANIPCRISFQVSSTTDSRTILDQGGAEQLLGHGDMLYLPPGSGVPVRVHGAFVSDEEVLKVVDYWRTRCEPDYVEEVTSLDASQSADSAFSLQQSEDEQDENYEEAVSFVLQSRKVSISSIQRKFRIGYNRAARIVEAMEAAGIVSAPNEMGNRQVLLSES